jgi:hypothetical protein
MKLIEISSPVVMILLLAPTVTAYCTPGYLDIYRCSDNWLQRQYRSSNCDIEWVDYRYCDNGCSDSRCITYADRCMLSVSLTTPSDVYLGDTISTTISLSNTGGRGDYVDFTAYLCKSDDTNCNPMNCQVEDRKRVYLPGYSTNSYTCTRAATESGLYMIKVGYSGCGRDPTIYSGVFEIKPQKKCTLMYLDNYRCFGNYLDRQLQKTDCTLTWSEVDYCPYGCSAGKCIEPKGIPQVSLDPVYNLKACEDSLIVFSVKNVGGKDSFTLTASGDAARWVSTGSTLTLDKDEKKFVASRISIPCDTKSGDYNLILSASDTASDSDTAIIRVESTDNPWLWILPIVIIIAAIAVTSTGFSTHLYLEKLKIFRSRKVPESF